MSFTQRLNKFKALLEEANYIVIGAGAGLSSAAGLSYSGSRFEDNFADFKEKFGISNMYEAMFYNFPNEESHFAYLARHILLNRYGKALPLYIELFELLKDRNYFVITTNVDAQFVKAGFDAKRLFAVQGDYGFFQCAKGCHEKLYLNQNLVQNMCETTRDCAVPSSLIPHCPKCGRVLAVHIRCDEHFVEDKAWHKSCESYQDFLNQALLGRTLLLEIGVGFNTPAIIRFPFERMAASFDNVTLVRINREEPQSLLEVKNFISFSEDLSSILANLNSMT